jgi:secreted trypsin-like serine protease
MQNKTRYAQYAEFPWMVAVMHIRFISGKNEEKYKGGGSLIHPKIVLTAASNIAGVSSNKIILRAGEWNMAAKTELRPHEDRKISKVKRHEGFKGWDQSKNLALFLLDKEFTMTAFINTICLPPKNMKFKGNCLSSGWGKNLFGAAGVYQQYLKKVSLPIVPYETCEGQLEKLN